MYLRDFPGTLYFAHLVSFCVCLTAVGHVSLSRCDIQHVTLLNMMIYFILHRCLSRNPCAIIDKCSISSYNTSRGHSDEYLYVSSCKLVFADNFCSFTLLMFLRHNTIYYKQYLVYHCTSGSQVLGKVHISSPESYRHYDQSA